MSPTQTHAAPISQDSTLLVLWENVLARLTKLARATEQGTFSVEAFADVERHLDCVPLAHPEYSLVRRRLDNAKAYLQRGEAGAARFELRQLARSLHGTARQWAPVRECVV
jgi:hypothetical protein